MIELTMDGYPTPDTFTTLRDIVVQRLRSNIVSGHSAPGTLYSVPSLAEEMEVSTTPVREALLELCRAGLVTPLRNRGFRVESTSLDALNDLFALRELIECYALSTLAERRPADPAELCRLAGDIEAAVERQDVPAYIETDRAFHLALVTQAGNPLLTRLVMELRDAMRLYGIDSAAGRARQIASVAEHYRLVELAASGEAKAAAALMSRHILDWKTIFSAALPGQAANTSGRGRTGPVRARPKRTS